LTISVMCFTVVLVISGEVLAKWYIRDKRSVFNGTCMRRHLEPENELQSVSFCLFDFHIRESNGEWSDCRLSSRWISSDDGEMDWNWHAGRLHGTAVIMPTRLSSYLCLFDSNLTS
jgi:hypothetical protein